MPFLRELLKTKSNLTDKLFQYTDDYEIYCALIGKDIEIGEVVSSPIRPYDEHPSFAIYIPNKLKSLGFNVRPEEIWFKDLADGRYGNVFKFVRCFALHHYNLTLESQYDVIKFLDGQLELGLFKNNVKPHRERKVYNYEIKLKDLYYQSRPFTKRDLQYWSKLEQEKSDLEFFNIKSIRYLLDDKSNIRKEFRATELAFIYTFWDKEKLYQPEAPKSFKFRNTCPGNDFRYYQGFQQLRGKDNNVNTLIITKSYKDVLVFYKLFNKHLDLKVDIIAPHAESINLSIEFVEIVKMNYDNVICVSDFDLAGVRFANQCKKLGFEYKFIDTNRILVNNKMKVIDKDISDYLLNNELEKTLNLLKNWNICKTTTPKKKKSFLEIAKDSQNY
jgi:hypothetical protein